VSCFSGGDVNIPHVLSYIHPPPNVRRTLDARHDNVVQISILYYYY